MRQFSRNRIGGSLILFVLLAAQGLAQIIIWPPEPGPPIIRPPQPPREIPRPQTVELRKLGVDATIRDQNAEVRLSQTFYNPNPGQMEAEYLFAVPEGSAIQDFVLMVDGQELTGQMLDAKEAQEIYTRIVRSMRDPGLLQFVGRGLLKTSVFPIPGHGERTVTLKYTELLKRDDGRIDFRLPLSGTGKDARRVGEVNVDIRIENKEAIKSLYSPSGWLTIARDGDHRATAKLNQRDVTPERELRLVIGLGDGKVGATVLSTKPSANEDGYFLLLASPDVRVSDTKPIAKNVIFVLDRSGSMTGKKIEQAQGALKFVLNNLREGDTFNIVAYDDRVEAFKPELQRYEAATRDEGLRYIENIRAGGSTNIDDALRTSLAMLPEDKSRPSYIIFMTDGLPTAGEKNEAAIAEHAKTANKAGARLFSFGVGYDLNSRLLDRLSGDNGGTTEFVKPDDDIEASVSRFYGKMTSPVLTDLQLAFDNANTNFVMPRELPDLFRGSQLVVVGRYVKGDKTTVRLTGRVGDKEEKYDFPAELVASGGGVENAFVERLWATRRIGELIGTIDLQGQNPELLNELVGLSKKYGILTPYTAFLAQEKDLAMREEFRTRAGAEAEALGQVSGRSAVAQRAMKQSLELAPTAAAPATYADSMSFDASSALGGAAGTSSQVAAGTVKVLRTNAKGEQTTTIRQIGAKTFYFRDDRWIDADAVDLKDQSGSETIEAFSDAWFELAKKLGPERAAWLDFEEPVTLVVDGKVYRIDVKAN